MTGRKPTSDRWPSHGGVVCAWIEENLVHGEGDYLGEPFRLRPDQELLLWRWYEHDPESGEWRWRRLFLETPKGTGKTELCAAMALAEFCGPVAPKSPNVPVAAASFEQADLLFGRAKQMATHENSRIRPYVEAYDTEMLLRGTPGRMFRVAAQAGTNDGGLPTLACFDELHEWTGNRERVHLVIGNSLAKRRNAREINLSTPGDDIDSLAGRLHARGLRVAAGEEPDDGYLFVWQTAGKGLDLDDPADLEQAIREANLHADDQLVDNLLRRFREIPRHEFERYHLARWSEAPVASWLADKPGAWDACEGDDSIPDGAEVVVGVDVALYHDSTAVVVAWPRGDGRTVVQSKVWEPAKSGETDITDVMAHIRALSHRYKIRAAVYDPRFFDVPAKMLEDEGVPMLRFDQSPERMVPACGLAYELIVAGNVVHGGQPTLTRHVLSAVQRTSERGWTLSKGKSRRKIDACIAMVMALWEAHQQDSRERDSVYEERGFVILG